MALHSINVISLCTGGGGLDLGLEIAVPASRTICMVEREAFAAAHLVAAMRAGVMDNAPIWSDVATFNGRPWRGVVDGIIGGIPCQPHSVAGNQLGEDDERELWSPTRRVIVQARPWFVLIENVAGMLSTGGAERVRRDLQKLGFAIEGGLFSAAEVGASHERARCFILAVADTARDDRWSGERGTQAGIGTGGIERRRSASGGVDVADASDAGLQGCERRGSSRSGDGSEAHGSVAELCGASMEHAARHGRGEGRPEHELRSGRGAAAGTGESMAEASNRLVSLKRRRSEARNGAGSAGEVLGDADDAREYEQSRIVREGGRRSKNASGRSLFPPGPDDLAGWRDVLSHSPHLEPAVRRMADGMAGRVDQLRLLGNGVVILCAAYAIRTLAARLAARGCTGAARLVLNS